MALHFAGYRVETRTPKALNTATYAHNNLSEVIEATLDRQYLFDHGIQHIVVVPKFVEVKKSTGASVISNVRHAKHVLEKVLSD